LPEAGLLEDFDDLKGTTFDPAAVDPAIRDFYEHTAAYRLEAWSEAGLPTRLFLWVLTRFVSRRMDQLNFPVSSLDLAGGMTSRILPMIDPLGRRVYTGWLRQLAADGRVIYTGLYAVERPGGDRDPCVKVSFPVPRGSATVFLRPEAGRDGSLRLISAGTGFGEPGFYRMLEVDAGHWRVCYLRTLRERFEVYRDRCGILRCEHTVWFLGFKVLRLAYKMERTRQGAGEV
jgi:hypothetical protein